MQRIWQDVLHGTLAGCGDIVGNKPSDPIKAAPVINWLTRLDSLDHRILLMEALECASWMKRWAEMLIPDKKKDDTPAAAPVEEAETHEEVTTDAPAQ